MTTPSFILASSSPRRLDLLSDAALPPDRVLPAEIDETPRLREQPRALAARLALEKAAVIAKAHPGSFVLGADTVVACGRRILPKAMNDAEVRQCLGLLSGRRHHVYTGVALFAPDGKIKTRLSDSTVRFKRLLDEEIEAYVTSGEGVGKAGGYAIQGRAALMIAAIAGSYSNIVGLPLYEVGQMLRSAGYAP